MPETKETIARQLRELLTWLSPLIEEYTNRVCPGCADVCCKQKHGMLLAKDIAYLAALGVETIPHDPFWSPDALCRFLGPAGCSRERWQRAWKCTWYFCDPLIKAMDEGPQSKSRRISEMVQRAMELREKL